MGRIGRQDLLHGAAIERLIPPTGELRIQHEGGGYIANGRIGLWIKVTRSSLPAQFTFAPDEVKGLLDVRRQTDDLFLGLVCPSAGVCCVKWDQLTRLIAIGDASAKTLVVRRPLGGSFRVAGTDQQRPLVVPVSRWGPQLLTLSTAASFAEKAKNDGVGAANPT